MKVIVTAHAVERFMQRVDGAPQSFEEARSLLLRAAENATPLKEKTPLGTPMWRVSNPPCVLLVKPDRETRGHVVVTVIDERPFAPFPGLESIEAVAEAIDDDPRRTKFSSPDMLHPPAPKRGNPKRAAKPVRLYSRECGCAAALEREKVAMERERQAAETHRAHISLAEARHAEKTKRHESSTAYIALIEAMRATVPHLFKLAAQGDEVARASLERIELIDAHALVKALRDAWRAEP